MRCCLDQQGSYKRGTVDYKRLQQIAQEAQNASGGGSRFRQPNSSKSSPMCGSWSASRALASAWRSKLQTGTWDGWPTRRRSWGATASQRTCSRASSGVCGTETYAAEIQQAVGKRPHRRHGATTETADLPARTRDHRRHRYGISALLIRWSGVRTPPGAPHRRLAFQRVRQLCLGHL